MLKVEENDLGDVKISSLKAFEKWVKKGGWDDNLDFMQITGINPKELIGKWFRIHHNRVFIRVE